MRRRVRVKRWPSTAGIQGNNVFLDHLLITRPVGCAPEPHLSPSHTHHTMLHLTGDPPAPAPAEPCTQPPCCKFAAADTLAAGAGTEPPAAHRDGPLFGLRQACARLSWGSPHRPKEPPYTVKVPHTQAEEIYIHSMWEYIENCKEIYAEVCPLIHAWKVRCGTSAWTVGCDTVTPGMRHARDSECSA